MTTEASMARSADTEKYAFHRETYERDLTTNLVWDKVGTMHNFRESGKYGGLDFSDVTGITVRNEDYSRSRYVFIENSVIKIDVDQEGRSTQAGILPEDYSDGLRTALESTPLMVGSLSNRFQGRKVESIYALTSTSGHDIDGDLKPGEPNPLMLASTVYGKYVQGLQQ